MIEKELYIIRHGQTEHNARGIVQGKGINLSLNDKGRKQAEAFYEAYKHIPFDVVYTSSLIRTHETAAPFIEKGIPHRIFSELDEISWGDFEGTTGTLESDNAFQQLLAKWKAGDINARPSASAESPFELQQRQKIFLEHLLSASEKKILIATHGRFIRAFMCTLTNRPLSEMETFHHVNVCLYKVNLLANGTFEIEINCGQEHLKAI